MAMTETAIVFGRDVRIHVHMRFFKILRLKRKSQKTANLLKFNFSLIYKCYVHDFKILSIKYIYQKGVFAGEKLPSAYDFSILI